MGAPPNPVDGTKYAELLMGVPMVLEYDSSTGGFKLVIDVENTLEVTFSGVSIDVALTTEDEVTAYITGTTSLNLGGKTVLRAPINISGSASGETELIAAVGGEKIKVLEAMLIGNADVSVFFQSGFTGTALTGPMSLPSDGDGFFVGTPAQIEAHHFETIAGENLVIDHDANVLLGGWINYYTEA